jgi:hypothetical protein
MSSQNYLPFNPVAAMKGCGWQQRSPNRYAWRNHRTPSRQLDSTTTRLLGGQRYVNPSEKRIPWPMVRVKSLLS